MSVKAALFQRQVVSLQSPEHQPNVRYLSCGMPAAKLFALGSLAVMLAAGSAFAETILPISDTLARSPEASAHVTGRTSSATINVVLLAACLGLVMALVKIQRSSSRLISFQDQYKTLLATAIDGFVVIDEQGRFLEANKSYCELIGYGRSELLRMRVSDVEARMDRQQVEQKIHDVTTSNHSRFQTQHRRQDGQIIDLEISVNRLPNQPVIYCFICDCTKRKQMERSLRENESMFRGMTSAAMDAVLMTDNDGGIQFWNDAATRIFGYTREEIIGQSLQVLLSKHSPEAIEAFKNTDQYCGIGNILELSGRHKSGRLFPIELSVAPLRVHENWHAVAIIRDMTRRTQLEEDLRTARRNLENKLQLFQSVMDAIPSPIFYKDCNLVYRGCNKAFQGLAGMERKKVVGSRELMEGELLDHVPLERELLADGFGIRQYECPVTLSDGAIREYAFFKACFTNASSEVAGIVGVMVDVSDSKKAQQELRTAKEAAEQANKQLELAIARANTMTVAAETANSAKSEFLAKMSHEIRTPLTAVLGYADLALDGDLSTNEIYNNLRTIRRNGRHLLDLIDDILDLSKIEADKLVLEKRRCGLEAIVADVGSMMRVRAKEKNLALIIRYLTPLPEKVVTDEARLRQCLVNLVGNAVKFTESGSVQIDVALRDYKGEPAAHISVTDSGIGINSQFLPRLFQPFMQAEVSTSRRFGGTGLGLAITQRIVGMLGGEISVQSEPGSGSTFTLIIPTGSLDGVPLVKITGEAVDTPAAEVDQVSPGKGSLLGRQILLAEDGPDNQCLIRAILQKAGAQVTVVENGLQAVQAGSQAQFDCILMDMQMPEMDGYEATAELRRCGFAKPVIALTANAMSGDRERCIGAGCTEYLTKPVQRAVLIRTIASLVSPWQAQLQAAEEICAVVPCSQDTEVIASDYAQDLDIRDVIDNFVLQLPQRLEAMREALANTNLDEFKRLSHRLKGAGGGYGYPSLTAVAKVLEAASGSGDVESCTLNMATLSDIVSRIMRGRNACAGGKGAVA